MQFSNYECQSCGFVMEKSKRSMNEEFPFSIECESCKGEMCRVFGEMKFDVAQGNAGNSKNNYTSWGVYHKSGLSPKRKNYNGMF